MGSQAWVLSRRALPLVAALAVALVGLAPAAAADADTAPPQITAVTVDPPIVDVARGAASATVTATITDAAGLPDCCPANFSLRSPSGREVVFGSFVRTSGDRFAATLDFARGAEPGRWQVVYLFVFDPLGNSAFLYPDDLHRLGVDLDVDVRASTPPAVAAGTDRTLNEGDSLALDATVAGADTATVAWGDGSPRETVVVRDGSVAASHVFVDDGAYTVVVSAAGADGARAEDSLTATVLNVRPTAFAGGPYEASPLAATAFAGRASDPGTADVLTYEWDLDYAGTFDSDAAGVGLTAPSATYAFPGTKTIALRVRDDDGGVSDVVTAPVVVRAPASTDGAVTGGAHWSRGIETLLELHSRSGHVWGNARFSGDGREVVSGRVDALVVSGSTATAFGAADGRAFRIDVADGGAEGTDTYRLRLDDGYDSGVVAAEDGNLVVHG